MEINAGITILCSEEGVTIEICDDAANTQFVEVRLTPAQWTQALGRLSNTPCDKVIINHLDRVGKTMEYKDFEFKMPTDVSRYDRFAQKEVARELARELCPEGWTPDTYFGSQGSFFFKDNQVYARTVIRRWVDKQFQVRGE